MVAKNSHRIILHVGLHKTGTTYLQNVVYPNIPNCFVVKGFHGHSHLIEDFLEKHVILSNEGFSGKMWEENYFQQFVSNMEKLKALYINPKVILGVRRQDGWLPSIYKQYLHESGHKPISYLYNKDNTGLMKDEDLLMLPRIQCVKDVFDDVFIYSQDSLLKRQDDFVKELCSFLGINNLDFKIPKNNKSQNVGVKSNVQIRFLRSINKLNASLIKISPKLNMYTKVTKKLKINPRYITQNYLRFIPSKKYNFDAGLIAHLKLNFQKDWEDTQKHISY